MDPQIGHQVAAQCFHIQNIVLHRPGVGKVHAHALVIKFRPENTGGVQKLQIPINRHPLLGAGNAGAILGFGGLAARHLIDKGGFSHIGDPQNHHPHYPAGHALFRIGPQLVCQQLPDGSGKFRRPHAVFCVGFQHGIAFAAEIVCPALRPLRIRLIHPVQHHHPGLPRRQLVHIRVPAGNRNPGVQNLTHRVHIFDLLGNHPPGFGHVAGIPLNIHYQITPIRLKFRFSVS